MVQDATSFCCILTVIPRARLGMRVGFTRRNLDRRYAMSDFQFLPCAEREGGMALPDEIKTVE
jgi:hypothetical protein